MSLLWQECADVEILNFTVYLYIFLWSFWHLRGTHLADVKFHWVLMQKPFSFRWKNICFGKLQWNGRQTSLIFFDGAGRSTMTHSGIPVACSQALCTTIERSIIQRDSKLAVVFTAEWKGSLFVWLCEKYSQLSAASVLPQHCRVKTLSHMDCLLVILNYVERVVSQIENLSPL